MRAGYPVHVSHIQKFSFPDGTAPRRLRDWLTKGTVTESYWCVTSRLVGECGHKHATEEEAKACLEPMQQKWISARWPKRTPEALDAR